MQLIGALITVALISGLSILVMGVVNAFHWVRARTSSLLPHSERSEECGEERERPGTDEEV